MYIYLAFFLRKIMLCYENASYLYEAYLLIWRLVWLEGYYEKISKRPIKKGYRIHNYALLSF